MAVTRAQIQAILAELDAEAKAMKLGLASAERKLEKAIIDEAAARELVSEIETVMLSLRRAVKVIKQP